MSRRNYDYKDYTKEGMTKLENKFRSDEQNTTPNNPFILRWQEKIKKKLINTSQSRSTKEEKELRQKHIDEIYAEWVKANKEGIPKTPSLRNIRKVVDQDMEDDARASLSAHQEEDPNNKRTRSPEEEETNKRYKQEKEIEELRVKAAYLEGRVEELVKKQEKLEKKNGRLREIEIKMVRWQTKVEERDQEVDKLEKMVSELKKEAIDGSIRIKELEVTLNEANRNRLETDEKLHQQEEEIRRVYTENGSLKAIKETATSTSVVSFADVVKKDVKVPEKNKIIQSTKRNTRPTIMIEPKRNT